jgi:hypothetical protein
VNPLLPWAIVGALLTLGGASTAAYFVGRDHGRTACEAKQKEAEDKAGAGIDASNNKAAEKEAVRKESYREITREIPTVIQAPVYTAPCVDAAGAGLLDRAVAVANGEAGGREPDAAAAAIPDHPREGTKP